MTDYDMPGMNGADFSKRMRYRFSDSLIIGLSCETRENAFLAAGADAFFEKPVDFRKLISMLRQNDNIAFCREAEDMVPV
jgi:DNA-binding response OmpR family regulator